MVRHKLAELATELEAARQLTYHALRLHVAGECALAQTAMAKKVATEMCCRVADQSLQLHGGAGYMMEYDIQRHWRDARLGPHRRRHERDHERDHRQATGAVMNEGLKLDEVVPVLRADLKIGEPTPGRGETTVTVFDPATGREVTVRGFELSIMRMLNGRRTAEEVLSSASQIGLPLTLYSLGVFIRRLRKEGFLGDPGSGPQNLLSWEPRNEWTEEIRRLYQEALREARADRLMAAKSRLDTLLARAPGTKEAQQLLHWVMERLRPEGGPRTPLFKDVYGEVEKGWFADGERQSELNETAADLEAQATTARRPPLALFAVGAVLLLFGVMLVVPFPAPCGRR